MLRTLLRIRLALPLILLSVSCHPGIIEAASVPDGQGPGQKTSDPNAANESSGPEFVPLLNGSDLSGWTQAKNDEGGELRFTAEPGRIIRVYGALSEGDDAENDHLHTEAEYSRYVFRVEYRWLGPRFGARSDRHREAGVLFHMASDTEDVWPPALECRLGDSPLDDADDLNKWMSGDLWVHGQDLSVAAHTKDGHFDPAAPIQRIGTDKQRESNRVSLAAEKPTGEWNEIELIVNGGEEVTFMVNGQVVNQMIDVRRGDELVTGGRISLEAKWAAIDYRNPRIMRLPDPE
ncbi:hypothetical protein Poly30_53200 [Planctomycetes bacterium Poly30]|uniref:3-keto-alpha-glucoside-1,2-lyase/3-keto-2-hydroxy-glucal hydratase domain-containing protein n=1 Tax=Saltatorellus ferox TaxID=2528018 RepID=A0A518F098_9BACT|nr:hypothetical protein Poly30_53200 [Planctomycetes bacterium Poly30]